MYDMIKFIQLINKVINMGCSFYNCSSLKDINFSNLNNNLTDIYNAFYGCSNELKIKIRDKYKINI